MSTKNVVEKFIGNIEIGNFPEAFSLLGSKGKYTVIGTTRASGTYHGADEVFEKLIPLLSSFKEAPSLTFEQTIIEGDRAALVAKGSGVGPTGPYEQPHYAFIMRIEGEEIAEMTEFMDTVMMESAIFGRNLQ